MKVFPNPSYSAYLSIIIKKILIFNYEKKWFVTLFANALPNNVAIKIIDIFFYEDRKILFRAILAIMKINYPKIKAF